MKKSNQYLKKLIPIPIKNDKYKIKRGNFSKIILLTCKNCKHKIGYYQKDGDGWLKRCYVDRLYILPKLNHAKFSLKKFFTCLKCKSILGKPLIYQKESREAFEIDRQKLLRKKLFQI